MDVMEVNSKTSWCCVPVAQVLLLGVCCAFVCLCPIKARLLYTIKGLLEQGSGQSIESMLIIQKQLFGRKQT